MSVDAFNRLSHDAAVAALIRCADIPDWAEHLAAKRPYASADELLDEARATGEYWTTVEVDHALADHPRIGEKPTGRQKGAAHSRREQASVHSSGEGVQAEIAEGNAAYEARFDRVFLIRAAGRSPEQILAALHERLEHDDDTERGVVAAELLDIALLRLKELVNP